MAFDAQIVTLTIFCEASGASQAEREAVAHVIRNRVKTGRWGASAAEVCTAYEQFSSWNGDRANRQNLQRGMKAPPDDPVMGACGQAWALSGMPPDPTNGATHYHDKSIAPPAWTQGATLTLETDKFRFYSGVR